MRDHCSRVVVSIDGTPKAHDATRKNIGGRGSHQVVRRNLLRLLHEGVSCVASMTILPSLCRAVLQNVRYLHGLGIDQIDVGPAYGTVTWSDTESTVFAQSLRDIGLYMHEVNATIARLEVGPLYRDSDHIDGKLAGCWGCHAASSNLAFLPTGQIAGCSALAMLASSVPGLILGDVFLGVDPDIVAQFIQHAQADGEDRPKCRACEGTSNCTGGCLAINYSTTRTALTPPDFYCRTISTIESAWKLAWGNTC
jgi:uncharacterized protein